MENYSKILLIDDDEIFIKPLSKFLTLNKFQVNNAMSAETAVNLQNNINFDLIITDLNLGESSGIDAINKIVNKYPDAKIIVISGYLNNQEFNSINKNKQVAAIFEKPIDYDELLKKINEIIQ
jgi:DNA-binding NtrC family response regulator